MDYKSQFIEINKHLNEYNRHPTENLNETFICLTKASYAKCIEFNVFLQDDEKPKNSFFYSPFLRGICEDLITLKYLKKYFVDDRDELLSYYMQYLTYSSANAQTAFFTKIVPSQISPKLKSDSDIVSFYEKKIKTIMLKNGFNKSRIFPSVENMAIDAGLKHLYDFFYHATSRMVHFSPSILLRMGWYNTDDKGKDGPTIFSAHNFDKYYEQFNKFYACYLFVEFSNSFQKELNFDSGFKKLIKQLKNNFNSNTFYPELVTFEELNQKRPGEFMRRFIELLNDSKK